VTLLQLVLITGATARLVRLAQTDTILDRPRRRLQHALGDRKAAELLWCPWCLSVWVGALVAASWAAWGDRTWWLAAGAALTASMATGLLNVWEDR
jgi:hypothetical protein